MGVTLFIIASILLLVMIYTLLGLTIYEFFSMNEPLNGVITSIFTLILLLITFGFILY